jgi:hypothetical protein
MQASCLPIPEQCFLANGHPKLHRRSPRLGVRGHSRYHSTNTPQLLEICNLQLGATTPEPGRRHTRIPADVMHGALPIILYLLPQSRQKAVLNAGS